MSDVVICEVGPRDGLQNARHRMPTEAKKRWISALAAAGLREIEVGSFVPPKLLPQFADNKEVVAAALKIDGLCVAALSPNPAQWSPKSSRRHAKARSMTPKFR